MVSISPNLQLQVPTVNSDAGPLYAQEVTASLSSLDSILGGTNTLSVAGNANVTLTGPQSQNLIQNFTGLLTGNVVVVFPAQGHFYCIQNNTTGNFQLGIAVLGSPNVLTIPQSLPVFVWSDGVTFRISTPPGWNEISSLAISGASQTIIPLPGPFRRFRVTLQGMRLAAQAFMQLQASVDGGASFVGSGYTVVVQGANAGTSSGTGAPTAAWSVNGPSWSICGFLTQGSSIPFDTTIELWSDVTGGNNGAVFRSTAVGASVTSSGTLFAENRSGFVGLQGINALSLTTGGVATTFTGTVILEGLP